MIRSPKSSLRYKHLFHFSFFFFPVSVQQRLIPSSSPSIITHTHKCKKQRIAQSGSHRFIFYLCMFDEQITDVYRNNICSSTVSLVSIFFFFSSFFFLLLSHFFLFTSFFSPPNFLYTTKTDIHTNAVDLLPSERLSSVW